MSVTLEVVVEDVVLGIPGTLSETVDSRSPVEILADEYIYLTLVLLLLLLRWY